MGKISSAAIAIICLVFTRPPLPGTAPVKPAISPKQVQNLATAGQPMATTPLVTVRPPLVIKKAFGWDNLPDGGMYLIYLQPGQGQPWRYLGKTTNTSFNLTATNLPIGFIHVLPRSLTWYNPVP